MDLSEQLARFIESQPSDLMLEAAHELLELVEADAVEQVSSAGKPQSAEELAERLEGRIERLRRRDDSVDGIELLEDAVAHLRASESDAVCPWTYEDGEGIRWFVLATEDDDEIVACYTSRPFVEADI
jgi:hypothetical protein